jgi:hypothetical protein
MTTRARLRYYVSVDDDDEVDGLFRADAAHCETFVPPDEWREMPPTFGLFNLEGLGGDAHYRRLADDDVRRLVPRLQRRITERRQAEGRVE